PAWIHAVANAGYLGGTLIAALYCLISFADCAIWSRPRAPVHIRLPVGSLLLCAYLSVSASAGNPILHCLQHQKLNPFPSHPLPHFDFRLHPLPVLSLKSEGPNDQTHLRQATSRQPSQRRPIHRTPLPRRQSPLR